MIELHLWEKAFWFIRRRIMISRIWDIRTTLSHLIIFRSIVNRSRLIFFISSKKEKRHLIWLSITPLQRCMRMAVKHNPLNSLLLRRLNLQQSDRLGLTMSGLLQSLQSRRLTIPYRHLQLVRTVLPLSSLLMRSALSQLRYPLIRKYQCDSRPHHLKFIKIIVLILIFMAIVLSHGNS